MIRSPLSKVQKWAWGTAIVLALYVPHALAMLGPHMSGCTSCQATWLKSSWALPGLLLEILVRSALARVIDHKKYLDIPDSLRITIGGLATLFYLVGAIWFATRDRRFAFLAVIATFCLASINAFVLAKLFAM